VPRGKVADAPYAFNKHSMGRAAGCLRSASRSGALKHTCAHQGRLCSGSGGSRPCQEHCTRGGCIPLNDKNVLHCSCAKFAGSCFSPPLHGVSRIAIGRAPAGSANQRPALNRNSHFLQPFEWPNEAEFINKHLCLASVDCLKAIRLREKPIGGSNSASAGLLPSTCSAAARTEW